MMRKALVDFTKIDSRIERQIGKVEVIAEQVRSLVKENASTTQSQDEYIKKYESLSNKYEVEYRKLYNLQKIRNYEYLKIKQWKCLLRT